jgi:hypothetical protein
MLFTVMLPNMGVGAAPAKISIDPTRMPEQAGTLGHPGDEFVISIKIEKVTDLYAAGFTVKFAPYASVLVASDGVEGDFLSAGGMYPTFFVYSINTFKGEIKFGITRYGTNVPGASGDGTLATIKLTVREAGESPVELVDVALIDSNGGMINADAWGSFYHGPVANLINANMPDGRNVYVGDFVNFMSKAVSHSDVPLTIRTRYEFERIDDGRRFNVYSAQNYAGGGLGEPYPFTHLYVDGYYGTGDWTNEGDSMVGLPDGNYMEATGAYDFSRLYTFEDITLAGREILNVDLEGYTRQPDGSTGWDFDPYAFSYDEVGDPVLGGVWCDSMGGTADWAWTGGRYYSGGPYDMPEYYDGGRHLWTEQGINSVEVGIENYCPSGPRQQIDAMRWKVEFSPITPVIVPTFEIDPYAELEIDPMTIAEVLDDMVGDYTVTVTLEYTLEGLFWAEGAKTRAFSFRILP